MLLYGGSAPGGHADRILRSRDMNLTAQQQKLATLERQTPDLLSGTMKDMTR